MNRPHSCPRRARLRAAPSFVLCCALLLALAGCGNKGPLVLPEDAEPAQAVATPAAAPEAPPAEASPTDAPPVEPPTDTPDPPRAHD